MKCFDDIKKIDGKNKNVSKFVFQNKDKCVESVLYKYPDYKTRTVLCISTQCGCPVGCNFCGTGKKFIANLTTDEILEQVQHCLNENITIKNINKNCQKLQIMFMSMGEPFLNYKNTKESLIKLHYLYPNAELLISTIGVKDNDKWNDFIELSERIPKIGLQFSIHRTTNEQRDKIIPYENKMNLIELKCFARYWNKKTKRKVYLNYCVDGTNNTEKDKENLMRIFDKKSFCLTFSVVCSPDETMKDAGFRNIETIKKFEQEFLAEGYNTRIFDPAGQDDIGGGCGQLWYVQEFLKQGKHK